MPELPKECIDWLNSIEREYGIDEANKFRSEAEFYVANGFDYLGNVPNVSEKDVSAIEFGGYVLVPSIFHVGQRVKVLWSGSNVSLFEGEVIDIKWNVRMNKYDGYFGRYLYPSYKLKDSSGNTHWSDGTNTMLSD